MPAHTQADAVAKLLFLIFVHGATSDGRIAVNEVERLQTLLADAHGVPNPNLRGGLECLRSKFPSWWARYREKKLIISAEAIRLRLAVVCIDMDLAQTSEFREGLRQFLRDLIAQEPSLRGMPQAAPSAEQVGSRIEIDRLLQAADATLSRRNLPAQAASAAAVMADSAIAPIEKLRPVAPAQRVETPTPAPANPSTSPPSEALHGGHVWAGGRTRVACMRVIDETHDTKTYTFAAVPPRLFRYQPGQHVTLECKVDGQLVRRQAALSSSPSRPYTLSVTIKRSTEDPESQLLYERLRQGAELLLYGPHGRFSCGNHPAPKLLLCAAGSGIAPMISMLRWIADTACTVDAQLVYNVRTQADIIFEQELKQLSMQLGRSMKLAIIPARLAPGMPWHGPTGRIDASMLQLLAPDLAQREVFVSGPHGYMDSVRELLERLSFPMARLHQDNRVDAPAAARTPTAQTPAPQHPAPRAAQAAAMRRGPTPPTPQTMTARIESVLQADAGDSDWMEDSLTSLSFADMQAGFVRARIIQRARDPAFFEA